MSVVFGVVPFIPASNIFFRVGFVIAERALFLPVIGLLIVIVTGFDALQRKLNWISNVRTFLLRLFMFTDVYFILDDAEYGDHINVGFYDANITGN